MNISFVIPTCGRESIRRTIASLRPQIVLGDEILVVQDPETDVVSLLGTFLKEMPVKILTDTTPGDRKWGYKARTYGMNRATKPWIHIIGDDDVYLPDALPQLRPLLLEETTPIICRMKRRQNEAETIWKTEGISRGNQAGEMIVFPNIPEKFGRFDAKRYDGDQAFIRQLVFNYGNSRWSDIEICHWRAPTAV